MSQPPTVPPPGQLGPAWETAAGDGPAGASWWKWVIGAVVFLFGVAVMVNEGTDQDDEPGPLAGAGDAQGEAQDVDEVPDGGDLEPVLDEQDQSDSFATVFDGDRDRYADQLEDTSDAETVDRIEYADGTVTVAVTSGWAGDDRQRDAAWGLARELASLWSDDVWDLDADRAPVWWPDLELTVDAHSYGCDGQTMRDIAERRIDRTSWEAAC